MPEKRQIHIHKTENSPPELRFLFIKSPRSINTEKGSTMRHKLLISQLYCQRLTFEYT